MEQEQIELVTNSAGEIRGVRLERQIRDGWFLSATFLIFEWQLVLSELKVFPGGERLATTSRRRYPRPGEWKDAPAAFDDVTASGLTTRLLREISVPELIDRVYEAFAEMSADNKPENDRWRELGAEFTDIPPVPLGTLSDRARVQDLEWALRLEAKFAERSRSPYVELAEEHGVTREQVRDITHKLREKGLLTGGGKNGRKSEGRLTQLARDMLAEED